MQAAENPQSQAILERLHDIHPVAEPAWWPPAPGWWILAGIVLLVLAWSVLRLVRKLRAHLRRKRLLREVDALPAQFDPATQPAAYLGALNSVFRVIALRAFPDSDCARLQGAEWVGFLKAHLPGATGLEVLESGPYRPDPEFDAAHLQAQARRWVARHG